MDIQVEFVGSDSFDVSFAIDMCPVTFKTYLAQGTIIVISRIEQGVLNKIIGYLVKNRTITYLNLFKKFLSFFADGINRIFF